MSELPPNADLLLAAFRDLHGARLHGFALVLVLGERRLAASLAADAIAVVSADAMRLSHPERAAASLRRHVVKLARRRGPHTVLNDERVTTLSHLGMDGVAAAAVGKLSLMERAALLAGEIEGFAEDDVATILGMTPSRARRAVVDARRRFMARHPAETSELGHQPGPIAGRVRRTATRAMGGLTP